MADRGSKEPLRKPLEIASKQHAERHSASRNASARYAGVGLQFAVSILVFLFAGQWLDGKLGSSPAFLLIGVFVGGGAAFYNMYRKLMADQRLEEQARSESVGRVAGDGVVEGVAVEGVAGKPKASSGSRNDETTV